MRHKFYDGKNYLSSCFNDGKSIRVKTEKHSNKMFFFSVYGREYIKLWVSFKVFKRGCTNGGGGEVAGLTRRGNMQSLFI